MSREDIGTLFVSVCVSAIQLLKRSNGFSKLGMNDVSNEATITSHF
jgi:hypothetical protein